METKIEFITQVEENAAEDLFEDYYAQNIVPLVEEENHLKRVFRSRFWGYLWLVCFLLGANFLIVLFRRLMYNYPINLGQLMVVLLVALAIISWPILCYYRAPKSDMFGIFLKFYGDWVHHKGKEVKPEPITIVPMHDAVEATHSVCGTYDGMEIELCDMRYRKTIQVKKMTFHQTVSRGVMVDVKFKKKINNRLLLFDKKGFRRKNKYPDLQNVTEQIFVPTANYFHIFADDVVFAKDMLPSLFFERILDMKDSFKASCLYVEIQEDYMRIYLENATMYFNNVGFWSQHVNKNKFVVLNKQMEQTLMAAQLVQVLKDAI